MATRKKPRKKTTASVPVQSSRRWLRALILVIALPTGLGLGLALVGYQRAAMEVQSLEKGIWQVPSRVLPAPLELEVGKRIPAGPLDKTLADLGYRRVGSPKRGGEWGTGNGGEHVIVARENWPGLEAAPTEPITAIIENGNVLRMRTRAGTAVTRAVFPGEPVAEMRGPDRESRRPAALAGIPVTMVNAVIAVEDRRFREHHGLDARALARAIVVTLSGRGRQGGSTLTQQLAKNLFLTHERTLTRKVKEVFYALALERAYTKDQLLEMYLNEIYLGQRGSVSICGVGQAAHAYFNKPLKDLALEESALLAGMIQAPNLYAPDRHGERARERRNLVLNLMLEQGFISRADHQRAVSQPIRFRPGPQPERFAPHVVDQVADRVGDLLPGAALESEGYVIETTIDPRLQRVATEALQKGLARVQAKSRVPVDGAVIVLRPTSGAILAMVGGRDYGESQFNRATLARRQPGSVFKPLVYLGAFHLSDDDVSPTMLLEDEPLQLTLNGKPWAPRNSDKKFHGTVTMRQALEQSLNVPTVRLAMKVGLPELVEFMRSLGVTAPLQPVPSLALGAFEVTPMEVAGAYTVLAGKGIHHPPYLLRKIVDAEGRVVFKHEPEKSKAVAATEAFMVRDLMRGVMERGTGKSARALGYPFVAAGKTGTTSDNRDAWFVGMDADLLTVVWLGNDDNQPTALTGASAALPIWVDVMKNARGAVPPPEDAVPDGVKAVSVCDDSHQRSSASCPAAYREVFWAGSEPETLCIKHTGMLQQIGDTLLRGPRSLLEELFSGIED